MKIAQKRKFMIHLNKIIMLRKRRNKIMKVVLKIRKKLKKFNQIQNQIKK